MNWTKEDFAAAVTKHSRSMFRAARAVLDCDADAEDAVGEAVLSAWQSCNKLRDPAAVKAWLVKIAVNCAYQQRRKSGRVTYLEDLDETTVVTESRRYDDLWEAVCALPRERRAVVTLFYYEDMTVEQIAKCLDVPEGTVKSRLSRARKQLKEMLSEET